MFMNDGNTVASCSVDKTIKLWDVKSHQLIQHYPAHGDSVTSISVHPSGNYLLSSSLDSKLKIWDLREGRLLYTLQGHEGAINSACFSADGHFIASGGADQLIMVWKSNLVGSSAAPKMEWGQGQVPRSASQNTSSTSRKTSTLPLSVGSQPLKDIIKNSGGLEIGGENIPPPPKPSQFTSHTANATTKSSSKPLTSSANKLTISVDSTKSVVKEAESPNIVQRTEIPPALTNTLDYIVSRIDLITETIQLMDRRLGDTEKRLNSVINGIPRGLLQGGDEIVAGEFDDSDEEN